MNNWGLLTGPRKGHKITPIDAGLLVSSLVGFGWLLKSWYDNEKDHWN